MWKMNEKISSEAHAIVETVVATLMSFFIFSFQSVFQEEFVAFLVLGSLIGDSRKPQKFAMLFTSSTPVST